MTRALLHSGENHMKRKFNKKMIIKIVIADILIFAVTILTFAYFDHVRDWGDSTPVPEIPKPNFDVSRDEISKDTLISSDSPSSEISKDENSSTSTEISKDDVVSSDTPSSEISKDDATSDTPDESIEQSEAPDGIFTNGEVISTETTYKSKYVSIELKEIYYENKLYMVQDIHIKHVESLAAGFANGMSPLSGEKSTIYQMVEHYRNNGYNVVAAINGDYCGFNSKGATIRNGVLYGKGVAQFDVCVLYKDGTMLTMEPDEFYAEAELAKGAWQVWDFGPSLLNESGRALTDFSHRRDINGSNPRTAIGYYEPGHYCFVVVGGRGEQAYGVKLSTLAGFMESIGCKTAYNLDGGRSSIMVQGEEIINADYQDVDRRNTDMVFIQDFSN